MRWNAVHLTTSQGGVRRAEAIGQQQGVQEQRQDGVLGGPRYRKESRQPTHAAWSSASAACIIHHCISCMLNRRVFLGFSTNPDVQCIIGMGRDFLQYRSVSIRFLVQCRALPVLQN
jgi:hypothetical protein